MPEEDIQQVDTGDTPQTEEGTQQADTGDFPQTEEGIQQVGTTDPPMVVVPVEIREMTRFENEKGKINIIHEITIGDLLVSTSLVAILIFMVLSRIIRR